MVSVVFKDLNGSGEAIFFKLFNREVGFDWDCLVILQNFSPNGFIYPIALQR